MPWRGKLTAWRLPPQGRDSPVRGPAPTAGNGAALPPQPHRCAQQSRSPPSPPPSRVFPLDVLGARLSAPGPGAGRVSLVSLSKMAAAGGGGAAGSGSAV